MPVRQIQQHRAARTGWMRAAVLGANDGVLSMASLVLGVAAANGSRSSVLIAGIAGLVAGAMSMAAGEYVSVHSQKDCGVFVSSAFFYFYLFHYAIPHQRLTPRARFPTTRQRRRDAMATGG